MLSYIKEILLLLNKKQRSNLYLLQVLIVFMAIMEVFAITSIAPFMALVSDFELIHSNSIYATMYEWSEVESVKGFILLMGFSVLMVLFLSSLISIYTTKKLSMFSAKVGTDIADKLYNYYMNESWLYHASGSSAQLTKNISIEAQRVSDFVIQSVLQINARLVLALFISVSLFVYNPVVAVFGLLLFLMAYGVIYKVVKKKLTVNGQAISDISAERFRLMNEGFGGIKDVLLMHRQTDFIDRFQQTGNAFAFAKGNNIVLAQVPRYIMELVAFGAMISLVLAFIYNDEGNLSAILPLLAVYALAAFKLLPALQHIYTYITIIKGNLAAYEAIKTDLAKAVDVKDRQAFQYSNLSHKTNPVPLKRIELRDVSFAYPGKEKKALSHLNMRIEANQTIGIVGSSGSGKSTAIDVLMGLLPVASGALLVNDVEINESNISEWQSRIGLVSQSIFLSERSIAENIAFGIAKEAIDYERVNTAVRLAHLSELVADLSKGVHTQVGERGVQLSGGQRQRIGIARALYHDADVLVFDEATSALDSISEKAIMDAIHDFAGKKTIIMIAHRLKTIEQCDTIFMIEGGELLESGNYKALLEKNTLFKKMSGV